MKNIGLLFVSFFMLVNVQAQNWELKKDKNGIKVYTKVTEDYRMPASKVVSTFYAPYADVVAAVFQVDNYLSYVPDCAEIEVLKRDGTNKLIYYGMYNSPWPAADRDLVIHLEKVEIPNGVRINMTNRADYMDDVEDVVRIPIYFGYWEIIRDNADVIVTLEYQTDPGGNVPDWMIQGAATKTPYNMFSNLIEFVR